MSDTPPPRRWSGPPLALQILGLLLAGLVVAQVVTLFLTMILPPAPSPQHSLTEVAAVLQGAATGENRPDPLQRIVQSGPPDLTGAGWLVSGTSERELAQRLGVDASDVRLAFYTPLPFAGTSQNRKVGLKANDGPMPGLEANAGMQPASFLILAQAPGPPPGMSDPSHGTMPARDSLPPGLFGEHSPDGNRLDNGRRPAPIIAGDTAARGRTEPLIRLDPTPVRPGDGGIWIGGDHGETVPEILRSTPHTPVVTTAPATPPSSASQSSTLPGRESSQLPGIDRGLTGQPGRFGDAGQMPLQLLPDRSLLKQAPRLPTVSSAPIETRGAIESSSRPTPQASAHPAPSIAAPAVQLPPSIAPLPMPARIEADIRRPDPPFASSDAVVPLQERAGGLFGLAPSPFVEGDFVAALKLGDGRWVVVQPAPEPFPNTWQRRVLLWFAIAFAVVAPVGWLFARRIVKPLAGFAEAAEILGRDPSAPVLDLDGPAEVGRAARAFNVMQSRLKSFVDDRTAMIGAISHDLRTPLTRLRFRIEDVDDDHVRDGMIEEVEQMEQMITSVLGFIQQASSPGARERLDLRLILDDVVEDAAMIGGDVAVESAESAQVEVDVLGMRRLFTNLVENAVKYGDRARVSLSVDKGEAVAEVTDDGPGVPEEDLERAFEPFYRTANAVSSDKRGSGLGLAVCRSIARAHGGDVRLLRSAKGFTAQLRVPLVFDAERVAA